MTDRTSTRPGRLNPLTLAIRTGVERYLRDAMFCLPGRITAFDPETQLAQVECGIQRVDAQGIGQTISVIDDVPVQFPGNGEWYLYHEIKAGQTEGLIHFAQRAIDTWVDQGGPVAPHEGRMLAPDDAFFVPGVRSQPRRIPNFLNNGTGLGNYSQGTMVRINDSGVGIEHGGETLKATLTDMGDIVKEALDQLGSETVVISSGSSSGTYPLTGAAVYNGLSADLQAVLARIDTLLGG